MQMDIILAYWQKRYATGDIKNGLQESVLK